MKSQKKPLILKYERLDLAVFIGFNSYSRCFLSKVRIFSVVMPAQKRRMKAVYFCPSSSLTLASVRLLITSTARSTVASTSRTEE